MYNESLQISRSRYYYSLQISRSRECCQLSMAICQFSMTILDLLSKIPPFSPLVDRSSILRTATLSFIRFSPLREQSTTDPGPTFIPPCTLVVLYLLNQASSETPCSYSQLYILVVLPLSNQSQRRIINVTIYGDVFCSCIKIKFVKIKSSHTIQIVLIHSSIGSSSTLIN